MKLYATTTSERATKGQGGKKLDIQLQGENGQQLGVIAVRYNEFEKLYYALYLHNNNITSIFKIEEETKAEKQKSEKCQQNGCNNIATIGNLCDNCMPF